jgi:hypothetical protein
VEGVEGSRGGERGLQSYEARFEQVVREGVEKEKREVEVERVEDMEGGGKGKERGNEEGVREEGREGREGGREKKGERGERGEEQGWRNRNKDRVRESRESIE